MKTKIYLINLAIICVISSAFLAVSAEDEKLDKQFQGHDPNKPIYYELVHENLRPDYDEFYVNTIFIIKGKPFASICRSQNKRAGELYDSYVNYGLGDYIAEGLKIYDINPKYKEIIVFKESTAEYFSLSLSYGEAVSRLIKLPNYQPIKQNAGT